MRGRNYKFGDLTRALQFSDYGDDSDDDVTPERCCDTEPTKKGKR